MVTAAATPIVSISPGHRRRSRRRKRLQKAVGVSTRSRRAIARLRAVEEVASVALPVSTAAGQGPSTLYPSARSSAGTPVAPVRWPAPTQMKKTCFSLSMASILGTQRLLRSSSRILRACGNWSRSPLISSSSLAWSPSPHPSIKSALLPVARTMPRSSYKQSQARMVAIPPVRADRLRTTALP